jgi:transcriptional regulator with PAS, ATPase and Fis domain
MTLQSIKQRFGIIGNTPQLNRAIEKAMQVSPTDISVLVTGESGVGKESIPRIIHSLSHRKHRPFIAVNCGAIPEGTIDSELFGHEKGSFTGATGTRKGYFEEADGGTIFLDEVGELPLSTQVRLLRVLETGEFIKVGSSRIQKTDVRIVAATNLEMQQAIRENKFREDLYYRLNTVEIALPPLRERAGDIHLIFRKFAADFSDRYNRPPIRLEADAVELLQRYRWPGNIRQLRNLAEQLSVVESDKQLDRVSLIGYLPEMGNRDLPMAHPGKSDKAENDFATEREILYKILFDMRNDLNDLKDLTRKVMQSGVSKDFEQENASLITKVYEDRPVTTEPARLIPETASESEPELHEETYTLDIEATPEDESLSLQDKELEMIKKALERHTGKGKRKKAAEELGISERTLYRKIKQYDLG